MEENDILVDISTLSDCETDAKYIKDIRLQSYLLGFLGLILLLLALEIKFNSGILLHSFINEKALTHPSVFFVFLIASFGNFIACKLLHSEAKTEEYQLIKLKAAFMANSASNIE